MLKKSVLVLIVWSLLSVQASWGESPIGYSIRAESDDGLYRIDMQTGAAEFIGFPGFGDIEGLTLDVSSNLLYGVNNSDHEVLVQIDLATGAGTEVGPLFPGQTNAVMDMGLSFGPGGFLYLVTEDPTKLYRVDRTSGNATEIGNTGFGITGLCYGNGSLYGLGGDWDNSLFTVDSLSGAATAVGSLGTNVHVWNGGLDFDWDKNLWGLDSSGAIYQIDLSTGSATGTATTLNGFHSLAIPEPCSLSLLVAGIHFGTRRSKRKN